MGELFYLCAMFGLILSDLDFCDHLINGRDDGDLPPCILIKPWRDAIGILVLVDLVFLEDVTVVILPVRNEIKLIINQVRCSAC